MGDTQYWIRTCQECGREQHTKPIEKYKNESWRDVKCIACKSEALDYGSWRLFKDGKFVRLDESEDWGP